VSEHSRDGRSHELAVVRFVEVDGQRLRVSLRGDGRPVSGRLASSPPVSGRLASSPPVLLITGLGASLDLGEPFERELCRLGFTVVSFDAPGVGQSEPYRRPRRMRGFARTIEGLLDALGLEQVDVVGVSLGGAAAQQLAYQAPHRVRRLVLAATGPGVGGVPGNPRVLLALATPRRYTDPEYFVRMAGRVYGGECRRDPALLAKGAAARVLAKPSGIGYFGQLYAISGWSSTPWLRRLPQRTLVLAGDDDPIVPLVNGFIMARLIRRARLHVVRGGGHLFLLERAAESAGLIAGFLGEADAVAA
jgi:poly(3-hydroxyoctanoate) depolymerase